MERDPAQFRDLRRLIERAYGLVYDGPDSGLLAQAIADRMRARNITDPKLYYSLVSTSGEGPAELRLLVDAATVRETRFFRGPGVFAALAGEIVPDLLERVQSAGASGRGLRAWSAGCSSGDEAYSLSLVLLESVRGRYLPPVKVLGTDISFSALSQAASGAYPGSAVRNVDEHLRKRYFVEVPSGRDNTGQAGQQPRTTRYRVGSELAASVEFVEHNLTIMPYPQYFREFHLILCRNVLMYFSNETASRVVHELSNCLSEGGYLVLDPWAYPSTVVEPEFTLVQCQYGAVVRRLTRRKRPGQRFRRPARPQFSATSRGLQMRGSDDSQPARAHESDRPSDRCSALAGGAVAMPGQKPHLSPSIDESSPEDRVGQARICANRGDFEQALSLLDALRHEAPLDPRVHLLMGEIYLQLSDPKAASYCFSRLIYLDPDNAAAHWRMADVYSQMERQEDELRELCNVLQCLEDPESRERCELPGDVLAKACLNRIQKLRLRQQA